MTRHKCFVCGAWRNGYCIKVTPLTHASIEAVLRAQGRDTEVTMGGHVCRETCYTDEMVERRRRDHSFDSTECSWVSTRRLCRARGSSSRQWHRVIGIFSSEDAVLSCCEQLTSAISAILGRSWRLGWFGYRSFTTARAAGQAPPPKGRAHHVGGQLVRVRPACPTHTLPARPPATNHSEACDDRAVSYGVDAARSIPSSAATLPSPSSLSHCSPPRCSC